MNNKHFKNFVDSNKGLKLTNEEKSDMLKNLSRFVDASPQYSSNNKKYAVLATLLLIGVGAGTSYAASNSLPGSLLYPLRSAFDREVLGIQPAFPVENLKKISSQASDNNANTKSTIIINQKIKEGSTPPAQKSPAVIPEVISSIPAKTQVQSAIIITLPNIPVKSVMTSTTTTVAATTSLSHGSEALSLPTIQATVPTAPIIEETPPSISIPKI